MREVKMANEQNLLTPEERNLTSEEASEMGKKGAQASIISRRNKRDLKARYNLALDLLTQKLSKQALEKGKLDLAAEISEVGAEVFKTIEIVISKKVKAETRLRALESIQDRVAGKPTQYIESKNTNTEELSEKDRYIMDGFINDVKKASPKKAAKKPAKKKPVKKEA
jgi:hypothetical protein